MITAGLDLGAKTVKALVLVDGRVAGKTKTLSGFESLLAAKEALAGALAEAGIDRDRVERIVATGSGAAEATFADETVTEVGAAARGARAHFPDALTVIDVGAEEGRGIRLDETGKVVDFAVNEKCAAGAGAFTEAMSRALEIPLEEMGPLSLTSKKAIPMNAQCAVFAESEVVSLVHARTPKEDIARAVHDAIASRITSMVRRIGVQAPVVLVGGLSKNAGFVASLSRGLDTEVRIPDDAEFVGAYGAALRAGEARS